MNGGIHLFLYYAIFDFDLNGINISFPDLEGAYSSGSDMQGALYMAKDLLESLILLAKEAGEPIPPAANLVLMQKKFLIDSLFRLL